MFRRVAATVSSILHKPLFGTRVIPRDASVDPALFLEEEYPVYCSKCSYLLRGLPDGNCPECGAPFKRGQLLVRQYVTGPARMPQDSTARQWGRRLTVAACAMLLLGVLGFVCMPLFVEFYTPTPPSPAVLDLVLILDLSQA